MEETLDGWIPVSLGYNSLSAPRERKEKEIRESNGQLRAFFQRFLYENKSKTMPENIEKPFIFLIHHLGHTLAIKGWSLECHRLTLDLEGTERKLQTIAGQQ